MHGHLETQDTPEYSYGGDMAKQSELFGRLLRGAISSLASYEGKNADIVDDEIGAALGVTCHTIQRYKRGAVPPKLETIEFLARELVRRAYLSPSWTQEFLRAAHHPFPEKLLHELFPSPLRTEPTPDKITTLRKSNLPRPVYSEFIMRSLPYQEIIDGLRKRLAVVLLVSIGGMGKTSLALEVALHCLDPTKDTPQFDAAVWVSDKDKPGSTTLESALDQIAITLDYPGVTRFALSEKQHEVEQLLRRERVLLIVDNFETIEDPTLLPWLLDIPEPGKVIITTRGYLRNFGNCWPIELRGMTDDEAMDLIRERFRVLKMRQALLDHEDIMQLVRVTGGNPKAIEMATSFIKHNHRTIRQVVDDIRMGYGELFHNLFAQAWSLLDQTSRRVLLSLLFFPDSVPQEGLAHTADVHGAVFEAAIERLTDLSLIDVMHVTIHVPPRYTLHPLVRAFAQRQLATDEYQPFEQAARQRWLHWCVAAASSVGFTFDDMSRLERMDPEEETLSAALDWSFRYGHDNETIQLAKGMEYYYYIRAFWGKKLALHLKYIEAAHRARRPDEELNALAMHSQLLTYQGRFAEARACLDRMGKLAMNQDLSGQLLFTMHHSIGMYQLEYGDPDAAQQSWESILARATDVQFTNHQVIGARHWLARCFHQQQRYPEARAHYEQSLAESRLARYERYIPKNLLYLAQLDLDEGNQERAAMTLQSCLECAVSDDREQQARIHYVCAQLYQRRGLFDMATASLLEAINLFERMGLVRELQAARADLTRLH